MKKKGETEEETWGGFSGGGKKKGKGGSKKGSTAPSGAATPAATEDAPVSASTAVNVPMALLSALLALSIPPPTTKDDVARCISDLETKKAWFEANNERKTQEEVQRVEALVKKMQKKNDKALAGNAANGEAEDAGKCRTAGRLLMTRCDSQRSPSPAMPRTISRSRRAARQVSCSLTSSATRLT